MKMMLLAVTSIPMMVSLVEVKVKMVLLAVKNILMMISQVEVKVKMVKRVTNHKIITGIIRQ